MAGYRQIHTKIWTDTWFMEQDPNHKLLFIYLFGNERASVCGLYELPLRVIAFETGIDIAIIRIELEDFITDNKIKYDFDCSVIWVKNMQKYQPGTSPNVLKRIAADIAAVPECPIKDEFRGIGGASEGLTRGSDTLISISSQSIVNLNREDDLQKDDPACLSPLSTAFCNATNIPELTGGPQKWTDALSDLGKAGVLPIDVETAVKELRDKKYCLVNLRSIVNPAIAAMSKRKGGDGRGTKPPTTAVETPKDWHA